MIYKNIHSWILLIILMRFGKYKYIFIYSYRHKLESEFKKICFTALLVPHEMMLMVIDDDDLR